MKIYVAGPMTGYPEHNFSAFHEIASQLRERGHEVVSPAEMDGPDFDHDNPAPWHDYLRRDIKLLVECDGIFLLPNWFESRGASLEAYIAVSLGMSYFETMEEVDDAG